MTSNSNDNGKSASFPEQPGFKEKGGTSEAAAALAAENAPALRQRCFAWSDWRRSCREDEVGALLDPRPHI
jgi:hypothetical protein